MLICWIMTALGGGLEITISLILYMKKLGTKCHLPKPGSPAGQSGYVCVPTHLHADVQAQRQGPEQLAHQQSSHSGFWQVRSPLCTLGACLSFVGWGWVNEWVCFLSWGAHFFTNSDRQITISFDNSFSPLSWASSTRADWSLLTQPHGALLTLHT